MTDISKTADKALLLLIAIADGVTTPPRLATRLEVNRTVVQRLLVTLLQRGFVVRTGNAYALAPRMRRLAEHVQPALRRAVSPASAALTDRTGETTIFQIPDGDEIVVLDEAYARSQVSLQARHELASRSPATATASGLAILAAWDDATVARTIGAEAAAAVAPRLRAARDLGHARTSDELQSDVSGMAIAVRRGTDVVGSLAILVPSARAEALNGMLPDLARAVQRIERALT